MNTTKRSEGCKTTLPKSHLCFFFKLSVNEYPDKSIFRDDLLTISTQPASPPS